MSQKIKVLLFDLGGVLAELRGLPVTFNHQRSVEDFWRHWLSSETARAFDTGRLSPQAFAQTMVEEFALPISPEQFLSQFDAWLTGLYPGAETLLRRIPEHYHLAILSNSNAQHWPRISEEFDHLIPHAFSSHLTGKIKPDLDAYQHVCQQLSIPAEQILFFDDNQINVDAAVRAGMQACRVRGLQELESALRQYGVL